MNTPWRRVVQASTVTAAMALMAVGLSGVASAGGAGLWNCSTGDGYIHACTTITSAPASGVQVFDQENYRTITLHNGDNVALYKWAKDTSGECGVGGDAYVWWIEWNDGMPSSGYIGDYYLNTGSVSNWNGYPDPSPLIGTLGDYKHFLGTGSGACNVFRHS